MKKLTTGIAMVAVAGIATAAPIDYTHGAFTANTTSADTTTEYLRQAITPDGGTDVIIDYSFDLDMSALVATAGAGSQMALFSIGANGNSGPIVDGVDGARTVVYLVSGNDTDTWGFGLISGGVWGGSAFGEVPLTGTGRQFLTEDEQGNMHIAGTLTLTDTVVANTVTVTSNGGYSESATYTTGALSDVGADNIHSYNWGSLQEWAKGNLTGEITFDNISVNVVPEPATLGLVATFAGAVLFIRRRLMM